MLKCVTQTSWFIKPNPKSLNSSLGTLKLLVCGSLFRTNVVLWTNSCDRESSETELTYNPIQKMQKTISSSKLDDLVAYHMFLEIHVHILISKSTPRGTSLVTLPESSIPHVIYPLNPFPLSREPSHASLPHDKSWLETASRTNQLIHILEVRIQDKI
jgi:hypothetical protein